MKPNKTKIMETNKQSGRVETTPHTPPTQAELDSAKEFNENHGYLRDYMARQIIAEVERLRAEYQAAVEDHDEEIGEFQNAVREEIIKLTGAPDSSVDGKGSDAGWEEFTLTEISQGVSFLKDRLTKEVEELRKDKETSDLLIKGLEGNLAACEQENEKLRSLINPFDVSTAMIRASADERLVLGEPVKNRAGDLCGLCDGFYEHEHPTLKCTFCGRSGLAENMIGHKCAAMQQKGEE